MVSPLGKRRTRREEKEEEREKGKKNEALAYPAVAAVKLNLFTFFHLA